LNSWFRKAHPEELVLMPSIVAIQVVVQRVDPQLLKDGMFPTVADGKFELVLQGPNAGLLQVVCP
jgi:hypothetical protein